MKSFQLMLVSVYLVKRVLVSVPLCCTLSGVSCAVCTGLTNESVIMTSVKNDWEIPIQLFSKPAFTPYTKEQIRYYEAGKQADLLSFRM